MNKPLLRTLLFSLGFSFFSTLELSAQGSGSDSSNILIYGLIAIGVFLLLWAILSLTDNLLQIEADKNGLDTEKTNYSLFPSLGDLFGSKSPEFTNGAKVHNLKKGFDIKIAGKPGNDIDSNVSASRYSLRPSNFRGVAPIPKVVVAVGDEVKAGDVIFFDKPNPDVKFVAPVSGEIVEIRRGDKRAITEVIILADKEIQYKNTELLASDASREDIVSLMAASGLWAHLNQRPFDMMPELSTVPVNIFVSTFDTAPLAPCGNMLVEGKGAEFQKGIDVLAGLTSGSVHLGLNASGNNPASAYADAVNCKKNWFNGPHPTGNVGIQIHHTAPINNVDKVWTLGVQDVITIGEFFLKGIYNAQRLVAIGGSEVAQPKYVRTYIGANVGELLKNNAVAENARIIAGDVLTGKKISSDDFLNFNDDQITVIKEGNYYEPFGWLLPLKPKPSVSKTLPQLFKGDYAYEVDTNTNGEERAFVVTGQYEKVLPMDIYPQHLLKAIMTGDFEKIEGLGITELTEEDVALCEFVCTSKTPVQQIIREGLDLVREQG